MKNLIKCYPAPETNTQEILLHLILYGSVSVISLPYMSGFRTRISELGLTHALKLNREYKTRQNKFGNTYTYVLHKLPDNQKDFAIKLYYKIKQGLNQ